MARILVLEDDPQIGSLLYRLLERAGHNLAVVSDSGEARRHISRRHVDLLIANIMPDGSGIDLCREAKRVGIPAILTNGQPDPPEAVEREQLTYVTKPFKTAKLLEHVRVALKSH